MKMLMNIGPPTKEEALVMTMASISPSEREVPQAESLRRRSKVLPPKFCLETATFRPESPLLNFSRSKDLKYQKMGTGGGPGWPQPTRARLGGLARPGGWWVHPGSPPVLIPSNIFSIFQKYSP